MVVKNQPDKDPYRPHKKGTGIFLAIIFTVSASGFFMGLQQTLSTISPTHASAEADHGTLQGTEDSPEASGSRQQPQAVGYVRMRNADQLKANHSWEQRLDKLTEPPEELVAMVLPSLEERQEVLKQRSELRAFEGAPPRIPHPIEQTSTASCLACHENGMKVKDRYVPAMSHVTLENCTQCHVPTQGPPLQGADELKQPLAANLFEGSEPAVQGERAFPGAPPQVPHSLRMRNNCLSCHGPKSEPALRTTHPFRQNCLQCHMPSAELDRHSILHEGFFPVER